MIDIIYDIFNQLVDLYQQFFGVPEGVTYALFGSRKKKKAKKKLSEAQQQIDAAGLGGAVDTGALDSIPNDFNSDFETTELVTDTGVIPGTDTPEIPYVPSFPYTGQQIILNSGRLHLNAKDDFIILNSKKSISLAAPGSINIDTEGAFIVNAQTNDELEALSAAIADIAIEISDLNSSINGEKAKQINLRTQMDALLLQISKKELELNSLKENQSASTSGLADVQMQKTQLQAELDTLEGKKVLLSLQVEQLAPQVQAADTVLSDLDASILKRSSQVTVLNKNISALKLQKEAFEKRINSNNQKITEIRILMQNKHKPLSTFNNIRNQVFALDMTVDNLEKQIEDMDEAVVGAEGKLNRFERACRREPACKDALNL